MTVDRGLPKNRTSLSRIAPYATRPGAWAASSARSSDVVELAGCSVLMAASAKEALSLLAHRRPCLIVLDILMPGMSGTQMLEEMRRTPELSELFVVLSTSAPERAPSGVPLLPKPIDIDALSGLMRHHCHCD
jgi:CheY-like chemotaxis protein